VLREASTKKGDRCRGGREKAAERHEEDDRGAGRRLRRGDEHVGPADACCLRPFCGGQKKYDQDANAAQEAGDRPPPAGREAAGRQAGPRKEDEG